MSIHASGNMIIIRKQSQSDADEENLSEIVVPGTGRNLKTYISNKELFTQKQPIQDVKDAAAVIKTQNNKIVSEEKEAKLAQLNTAFAVGINPPKVSKVHSKKDSFNDENNDFKLMNKLGSLNETPRLFLKISKTIGL